MVSIEKEILWLKILLFSSKKLIHAWFSLGKFKNLDNLFLEFQLSPQSLSVLFTAPFGF